MRGERVAVGMIRLVFGVLGVVLVAATCGGENGNGTGPNGPVDMGDFSGTVTGDLDLTLNGQAIFGVRASPREWTLFLSVGDVNGTEFDFVSFFRDNTARPGTGTYTVHNGFEDPPNVNDFRGIYFQARSVGTIGIFLSDSTTAGTLTILTSSDTAVTGEYSFIALDDFVSPPAGAPDSLFIEGEFRAVPGTIPGNQ